jgi:adenosylhomocysteine nucleosidase
MSLGTLVCFAVKEEAKEFQRRFRNPAGVEVLLTGMGTRNAERAVRAALARGKPGRVITAGFAGGLAPALAAGTVVYSTDEETGLAAALRAAGARPVRFHFASKVATTAAQKRALHSRTGAEAVEMESEVIRSVCRELSVPAATIRVILDIATEDLALDFNQLMTPDLRLDPLKLAWCLVKAPWKIPALMRLQKTSAAAAATLADTLGQVLSLSRTAPSQLAPHSNPLV